jgi:hypothetical protein
MFLIAMATAYDIGSEIGETMVMILLMIMQLYIDSFKEIIAMEPLSLLPYWFNQDILS